jgi:Arc/MetJ family transcription regulator
MATTSEGKLMRTNVEINDALMADAMVALGTHTKKETIEVALERVVREHRLRKVADLWGSAEWEGDLMEWRRSKDYGDSDG